MFNLKSKSEFPLETTTTANSTSLIGNGAILKGNISCSSDIRIDGILTGNITSTAKVVVGPNGLVEGDISGQQADIMGKVLGTIKVKDLLQLKESSVVNGNVYASKLQVEPSATFNGECHMGGGNVVEMSNLDTDHAIAKSK
jgi:cytoskeletal protein CcmA (bactofilin family)